MEYLAATCKTSSTSAFFCGIRRGVWKIPKGAIRGRELKKDRQCSDQKRIKRQTMQKEDDWATRTPQHTRVNSVAKTTRILIPGHVFLNWLLLYIGNCDGDPYIKRREEGWNLISQTSIYITWHLSAILQRKRDQFRIRIIDRNLLKRCTVV